VFGFGFSDALYTSYHPPRCHQGKSTLLISFVLVLNHFQLLEGIGLMSKSTAKKASASVNYQDDVTSALEREHEIDATADEEADQDDEGNDTESTSQVKAAVLKVSFDFMILLSISAEDNI
jgi:hypothetical protein